MLDISSEDLVSILKEKEETKRKEMDILEQQRKDREAFEKEALDKKNVFKDYLQILFLIVITFSIIFIFIKFKIIILRNSRLKMIQGLEHDILLLVLGLNSNMDPPHNRVDNRQNRYY